MHTPIVTITGTKGKTSIARVADALFCHFDYGVLRVDTDGHFINGRQRSNREESYEKWGLVPNVCPGRFLYDLPRLRQEKRVAILEAALGSSRLRGLGYAQHQIGVFTNIFREHITGERIKHKGDIFKAKRFVFTELASDGWFIFNTDDSFLVQKLAKEDIPQRKIAVGKKLLVTNQKKYFKAGNLFVRIDGESIYLNAYSTKLGKVKETVLLNCSTVPFTFNGAFTANMYNAGFALAIFIARTSPTFATTHRAEIQHLFDAYTFDPDGGRLVQVKNRKNIITLIDFAHERESLKAVAQLAARLASGKVIGVLRIDPQRLDEEIFETARDIAPFYDCVFVYDKVDGVNRTRSRIGVGNQYRSVGETAKLLAAGLRNANHKDYTVVLKEREAFKKAYAQAAPGDVIIFIAYGNDNAGARAFVKQVMK